MVITGTLVPFSWFKKCQLTEFCTETKFSIRTLIKEVRSERRHGETKILLNEKQSQFLASLDYPDFGSRIGLHEFFYLKVKLKYKAVNLGLDRRLKVVSFRDTWVWQPRSVEKSNFFLTFSVLNSSITNRKTDDLLWKILPRKKKLIGLCQSEAGGIEESRIGIPRFVKTSRCFCKFRRIRLQAEMKKVSILGWSRWTLQPILRRYLRFVNRTYC